MFTEGILAERVAIVTGGGRGLGAAIAHGLALEGARVVVAAQTLEQVEQVASEIRNRDQVALAVQANVTEDSEVKRLIRVTMAEFGRIDILVNNAGVLPKPRSIEKDTVGNFFGSVFVDAKATFLCTQAVVPTMKRQLYGRIINISAPAAKRVTEYAGYGFAKAGILKVTRDWAQELGPWGITVNSILPLLEGTPMFNRFFEPTAVKNKISLEEAVEEFIGQTIIGRSPSRGEIGAFVTYLSSPSAIIHTGQAFNVDCGLITY
jgi:3-oxoacyl-[acyl-carrier protein] reductase